MWFRNCFAICILVLIIVVYLIDQSFYERTFIYGKIRSNNSVFVEESSNSEKNLKCLKKFILYFKLRIRKNEFKRGTFITGKNVSLKVEWPLK